MARIILNDVVDVKIDVFAYKYADTSLYVEKLNGETLWSLRDFYLMGIEVCDSNGNFKGEIFDGHTLLTVKRLIVENHTEFNGENHLGVQLKVWV